MYLNSFRFLLFFAGLLAAMFILQCLRKKYLIAAKLQLFVLLVASYVFLGFSDVRFCAVLVGVSAVSYGFGIEIEQHKSRGLLAAALAILIGVLCYFKYAGFFAETVGAVLGMGAISLKTILPLGVSFYVFSAISYIVDVYRGKYPAERNVLRYALFTSFFPKLTAGPIVRADVFLPQAADYRGLRLASFETGIQIFVFGLFKKIVLADRLGVFVDDVFFAPSAFNTGTVLLAVFSYAMQIYLDFSGYSDMAIGVSGILGFDFPPNFNLPYLSQNVSEFWGRWHISLSSWLRDYVYFPLGGSRKGTLRACMNIIVVMLVSGIWHGAGWTFLLWGAGHGVLSCINKILGKKLKLLGKTVNIIITFISVSLLWIFFRAESVSAAFGVYKEMFTAHAGISQPYVWSFFAATVVLCATMAAIVRAKKQNSDGQTSTRINGYYPFVDLRSFWGLVAFLTVCGLTVILGYFGNTAFIYGAF